MKFLHCPVISCIAVSIALLLAPVGALQAPAWASPPEAVIGRCQAPPSIDGALSPGEWDQATRLAAFSLVGLNRLAADQTACFVCFDDEHLYMAFDCPQATAPVTGATNQERGGALWLDDAIEVFIREKTSRTYYHLLGNSIGQVTDARNRDASWDGDWSYAATLTAAGWSAEMAVPVSTIEWEPLTGARLGLNVARDRQSTRPETSSWAPVMRTFHDPSTFGALTPDLESPRTRLHPQTDPKDIGAAVDILNPTGVAVSMRTEIGVTPESREASSDAQTVQVGAGQTVRIAHALPGSPGTYTVSIEVSTGEDSDRKVLLGQTWRLQIPPPLGAELRRYFFHNQILAQCCMPDTDAGRQTDIEFSLLDGDTVLERRLITPSDAVVPVHDPRHSPAMGRRVSTVFDIADLKPGEYAVGISSHAPDGEGESTALAFSKPEPPEWLDCEYGTEDILPAPWTPMAVNGNSVSCWGREYQFAGSPVPSQIINQGNGILSGPIRLRGRANGRMLQWSEADAQVTEQTDTAVRLSSRASDGGLTLAGTTLAEFDGLMRVDLTLEGSENDRLDAFMLEIPIKKQYATLFFGQPMDTRMGPGNAYPSWVGTPNGFVPQAPASGPFTNYIWLGNNHLGLVWCCEGPRNWSNADPDKAIEVIPHEEHVVLRINFVDAPVDLAESLDFTFGLQATPVKQAAPRETIRFSEWYGAEIKRPVPLEHAWLRYPAAGNLNPDHGCAHLWVKLAFDPHVQLAENASRGDHNRSLFYIDWPNGDRVGFYWNIDDRGMRVYVRDGLPEQGNYVALVHSRQDDWAEGQEHVVTLSWGERLAVYVDGKQAAVTAYQGTRPTPLDEAQLLIGGNPGGLLVDAIKISDTEFGGGGVPELSVDEHTLLLDTFAEFDGDSKTVPQKCAIVDGAKQVGILDTRVTKQPGSLGTQLDFRAEPQVRSRLDVLAERGIDIVQIHEIWTETEGYPMTNVYGERLRSFVKGAHDAGLKVILYLGCEIGDNCEEYRLYKDEIVVEPWVEGQGYKREPAQVAYDCSFTGQWQNFMLYYLKALIEEYDIDGFYLDGAFHTYRDMNQYHGAGYVDRDGVLQPSFQIWEIRQWMRRMRTMAESVKPGFWIDMHDSSAIFTPTNSFGDSIWNGEQYVPLMSALNTTLRGCLRPDTFRASFLGAQYGFPSDFLAYAHIDEAEALALVHGIPVRNQESRPAGETIAQFTKAEAEFFPYYETDHPLRVEGGTEVAASFYRRADGSLLLVVSNLGETPADVVLRPDDGMTNLPGSTPAVDALTGQEVGTLRDGIALTLDPWMLRLVRVDAAPGISR